MIELAEHIEALLLENDCVIVPGLGGFVGHYMPAARMAEENRFLPPMRVIGFNPSLKMNDGLLVQSYASVYGTSFSDATRRIDRQVRELQERLHEEGKVELANIGELHCSVYGQFSFVPYDTKLTTPYLYGWQGFEMRELQEAAKPKTVKRTAMPHVPAAKVPGRQRRWRMNEAVIRHAVSAVAAVLLFFLLSTPIENTGVVEENYAHLMPGELWAKLGQSSLVATPVRLEAADGPQKRVAPVAVKEVKVKAAETAAKAEPKAVPAKHEPAKKIEPAKKAVPAKQAVPAEKAIKKAAKPYHIIVASVSTEQDAHRMANELKQKGFDKACAVIGDGKMRVSIRSCGSQAEAYKALKEIRGMQAYQSAWVLH